VTIFVTRQGRNGRDRKDEHGIKRSLQDIDIAKEIGETVAIASFVRNGRLSLLMVGGSPTISQALICPL
jgi:hypothetical protein